MGGIASAAYLDLMIRSCPSGLQGTLMMMSAALYAIVGGLGNVLGTNLYDYFGGFTVCVIAITVVYALILPVLLLVPKRLIDTADGQTPEVALHSRLGRQFWRLDHMIFFLEPSEPAEKSAGMKLIIRPTLISWTFVSTVVPTPAKW